MDANLEAEPTATNPVRLVAGGLRLAGVETGAAYERHAAEINGFLIRAVRDVDVAADLLADTFTRLLIEERAGRWPDQPRAWLYRVSSNLVMSRGRHLKVTARVDRVLFATERDRVADSPDAEVLRRERRGDLDHALASLGLDARTALLLAAQGFDGVTIAATIGRTEMATRTLMCRARVKLRELLREDER
jgi:RNA polymerase sigma-70 factor (ECF subfamily)